MPKTRSQIAREVAEILTRANDPKARARIQEAEAQGQEAYQNIQQEARSVQNAVPWTDNADSVAAQKSPRAAWQLVNQSDQHADRAARYFDFASDWVRQAKGTSQEAATTEILQRIQAVVKQAKANASATKRAFEKRFGKYDPHGNTDQNETRRRS